MAREPMRVDPISRLTGAEAQQLARVRKQIYELNQLLEERGSAIRYRLMEGHG